MSAILHATNWARTAALALAIPIVITVVPSTAQAVTVSDAPSQVRAVGWGSDRAPADQNFIQVSQGYWGGVGITPAGRVESWGTDYNNSHTIPASLNSKVAVKVSQGYNHGIAQTEDGELTTWGHYRDPAQPFDPVVPAAIPQEVADADIVDFAAGFDIDLALTSDGEILVWGQPRSGDLDVPASLDGKTVTQIDVGSFGPVVLTDDGKITTWGSLSPTPSEYEDENFVAVETGESTVLALNDEGKLFQWGAWGLGQSALPASLDGKTVTAFSIGGSWAMAATSDGEVVTWGNADGGQTTLPAAVDGKAIVDLQATRYGAVATYGALVSESEPWINGTPAFGDSISVEPGSYDVEPDGATYQWNVGGSPVDGATGIVYWPTAADVGKTITVTETAYKGGWASASATSEPSDAVEPMLFGLSPSTKFSGAVRVGKTVSVRAFGAEPAAERFTYQWTRGGAAIAGARGTSYRPTNADLGRTLGLTVTAHKAGYQPISSKPVVGRVVVGAAKLRVSVPSKVKRGKKLTIKVSGLAPRESYSIRMFGFTYASGKADSKGRINRSVKISSTAKPSRQKITVYGSFTDRVGSDSTKVTKK